MLSVVIIAKNEAHNIDRCLASVDFADEIIVIDGGSTDKTVEIAKKYTPHVYIASDWLGYGVQKQRALAYATQEWVLNLDADECVSPALRKKIQTVIHQKNIDGCRIPIRLQFYNQTLRFSSSPTRHIRLFRREHASYSDDIVHEKVLLPANAKIIQLHCPILHYSFRDLSHAIYKLNRYSSYSAKVKRDQFKKPSFFKTFFASFWMFIRCYLLQGGLWDGKAGFLFAIYQSQGTFYRGMKQIYPDSIDVVLNKDVEQ